jgi:hypothetical protein
MEYNKSPCYQISETFKDTGINIQGHIIINDVTKPDTFDENIFINQFSDYLTNIIEKKRNLSSQGLSTKCQEAFPYAKFLLKIIPINKKIEKNRIEDKAFGMVRFLSSSGTPRNLFGTSIKHQNTITMELCHAYSKRSLNTDFHFEKELIARVEMSKSQFADLITSLGISSGSPCTIRYTELNGSISDPPFEDKKMIFRKEFDSKISDVGKNVKEMILEIQNIFDTKKNLNKADREKILNCLRRIYNDVSINASFMTECFTEQMEKTVHEAKGEVEAYIDDRMRQIANEAIASKSDTKFLTENFE